MIETVQMWGINNRIKFLQEQIKLNPSKEKEMHLEVLKLSKKYKVLQRMEKLNIKIVKGGKV